MKHLEVNLFLFARMGNGVLFGFLPDAHWNQEGKVEGKRLKEDQPDVDSFSEETRYFSIPYSLARPSLYGAFLPSQCGRGHN
jgi:hypothetical protein